MPYSAWPYFKPLILPIPKLNYIYISHLADDFIQSDYKWEQ